MCLIAFDHRPGGGIPLRLVANRDEFHARPSAALAPWDDAPGIVGGRDLEAGGTWLAVHRRGRIAAVTNVRDPGLGVPSDAPSRGALVREALQCPDLPTWLARLADGEARAYAGFNLLVGDGRRLWHLHRGRDRVVLSRVSTGLHGLSNADLDTPWPKLIQARQGLAASLHHGRFPEDALRELADAHPADDRQLPDTGIGLELERRLSAAFIRGEDYGTRASTWLTWHADGHLAIGERRFGPLGTCLGENLIELHTPPPA
ncbi:NRDE family protein [Halomonas nitroreducens]|uniref:NRDE family protein n=1 Tax=Halomonas nitroreducens TaxID=447425 RepID=A0A3S0HVT6_9GAMM|nr:NRDE family protein [Halomonas nitroreducens]RTR07207.1 NRDE family protein [Halomonas nitroreducens]